MFAITDSRDQRRRHCATVTPANGESHRECAHDSTKSMSDNGRIMMHAPHVILSLNCTLGTCDRYTTSILPQRIVVGIQCRYASKPTHSHPHVMLASYRLRMPRNSTPAAPP